MTDSIAKRGSPQDYRKVREQRKLRRAEMESQVKTLECVLANLMFTTNEESPEESELQDQLLDDDSIRMRSFLKSARQLVEERQELTKERVGLIQRMHEKHLVEAAVRSVLRNSQESDEWDRKVHGWRAVTHANFKPWTDTMWVETMEDSLQQIAHFFANEESVTSGLSFLGWRDKRRVDHKSSTVQFCFDKLILGDAAVAVDRIWSLYTASDDYAEVLLGPNAQGHCEVVQRIDDDTCLLRVMQKYPDWPDKSIHMMLLLFRVDIDADTTMIVRRTVPAPEVVTATHEKDTHVAWTWNFSWTVFQVAQRNASGVCTEYACRSCGSISWENTPWCAMRWLSNALVAIVRAETYAGGGRGLLGAASSQQQEAA